MEQRRELMKERIRGLPVARAANDCKAHIHQAHCGKSGGCASRRRLTSGDLRHSRNRGLRVKRFILPVSQKSAEGKVGHAVGGYEALQAERRRTDRPRQGTMIEGRTVPRRGIKEKAVAARLMSGQRQKTGRTRVLAFPAESRRMPEGRRARDRNAHGEAQDRKPGGAND